MKIISKRRLAPLTLVALALASGAISRDSASAQNENGALRLRAQKRVAMLFGAAHNRLSDLHLTANQQTRLRVIAQKNAPLLRAAMNDKTLSSAQKSAKISALKGEANAVFTSAQQQKLAAARHEAFGQLVGTASWVSSELGLNATQQEKIQRIVMASYAQSRATRGGFGALRGVIMGADDQIQGVLTAPQKTKWNVIKTAARAEIVKNTRVWRAEVGV